jgi:hypothetical protein
MSIRILVFIAAFIVVVILPWWVSTAVLLGLTIYFPFYLEVLFFGFLFDILYPIQSNYLGLILATAFLIVVLFIKTRLRT